MRIPSLSCEGSEIDNFPILPLHHVTDHGFAKDKHALERDLPTHPNIHP